MPSSKAKAPSSTAALTTTTAISATMTALASRLCAAAAGQEEICLIQTVGQVGVDNFLNTSAHEGI